MGILSSIGKLLGGGLLGGGGGGGFGGTKPEIRQIDKFTPEQKAALAQLLSQGMRDSDPDALESKYQHKFERETVPGIAERFTAMGGGQRSSAFEESLRRGGLDLMEQLAGLRMQSGMQKLGYGMQPQFDTVMTPGSPGMAGGLMEGLGGLLGGGLGSLFGLGYQPDQNAMGDQEPVGQPPSNRSVGGGAYIPGQPQGMRRSGGDLMADVLKGIQF